MENIFKYVLDKKLEYDKKRIPLEGRTLKLNKEQIKELETYLINPKFQRFTIFGFTIEEG